MFTKIWVTVLLIGQWSLAATAQDHGLPKPRIITDDAGTPITLAAPARRIISLAPHVTENLFAIGAGDLLVGAVEYSDYPAAANQIPRVGGYSLFDVERIAAMKPDLIIGWQSGNPDAQLEQIKSLGIPLYLSQPNRFEDVATELIRFGQLTGRETTAKLTADQFTEKLQRLRDLHARKPKVRVFYQIWSDPLMTIGGNQIISSAITACGGENVFAAERIMAPAITQEAVLAADAEAFVAGGMSERKDDERKDWLNIWRRWPKLLAVQRNNLFFVPASQMQRHTPRLLDGTEQLCAHLDTARARRQKSD